MRIIWPCGFAHTIAHTKSASTRARIYNSRVALAELRLPDSGGSRLMLLPTIILSTTSLPALSIVTLLSSSGENSMVVQPEGFGRMTFEGGCSTRALDVEAEA